MAQCETCGNEYDKAFEVIMAGTSYTFDSFECAIQTLAPTCNHCGCRIIGHGVEADDMLYCCAHCAGKEGVSELQDRV
jgi:Zn finger protein HypA/HybF involved in hydrogenase expression